jgi:hypothetical protein
MNPWSSELRMLGAISAFVIPARLLQLAIAMKEKACEEATRTARFSHQNYGSLVERRSGPVWDPFAHPGRRLAPEQVTEMIEI